MGKANRALWRQRDFMLLWGGQAVSQTGSQVTILALPLVAIVVLGATPFEVGLLSAATTGAYLLVAFPAGVLADRVSKRGVMLACDVGSMAVIGWVPAAQAAGILTIGQLYVVALLASSLGAFFLVSYTSYLPSLIERGQLVEGNGKLATTQAIAQVAGPGLGALLVGLVGASPAMASDAISFALAAACLFLIRAREPRPAGPVRPARPRFGRQSREGLAYVAREPILRKSAARPGWRVLLFVFGWMSWTFGSTLCGTALTSYQQAVCPAELRGRVSAALRWVSWGTLPLGGLGAGALGRAIGVHATLWIAVTGGCLSGLWLYLSPLRRMRDLPAGLQPA